MQGAWYGTYYTYHILHSDGVFDTTDPYGVASGIDSERSMVVNLAETDPAGWEQDERPEIRPEDRCVYELHVKDFSSDPHSGISDKHRGKFLAFTEEGTTLNGDGIHATGFNYLKSLGISHVHLLPVFDFGSVPEDDAEAFNWGYDPQNFNCPEGSYSTNPYDGRARVAEFKRLVHALHCQGIRVIMDVVYNHTYATADSPFNKIFNKYYYRLWGENGEYFSNGSGCGNEIATERFMVRKYIIDSLVYWATEYKIDGFRFDLMGLYDIETMNKIDKTLHAINPDIILYGEGWIGGDSPLADSKRAMKLNARHTPNIAFFSDDFRDTIKGNNFENRSRGYVNGATGSEEYVKEVMCGRIPHPQIPNLTKFAWTLSPCQTVNYVEAHDNLTLWDKLIYTNPTDSLDTRKKMDKMAAACVFLAQGIPFIQAGQDFLRSKPLPGGAYDHNSYNSPDAVNSLKWDRKSEFRDVFDYYKGLIEFRKAHSALRMFTAEDIGRNMKFFNHLPQRIVGFGLYGDCELEEIIVFFNPTNDDITLHAFGEYNVYIDGDNAGNKPLYTVCDDYIIKPHSTMVMGRPYPQPEEEAAE